MILRWLNENLQFFLYMVSHSHKGIFILFDLFKFKVRRDDKIVIISFIQAG